MQGGHKKVVLEGFLVVIILILLYVYKICTGAAKIQESSPQHHVVFLDSPNFFFL